MRHKECKHNTLKKVKALNRNIGAGLYYGCKMHKKSHIFYYKWQNLVYCCLKRISNNVWLEGASKFAKTMSNGGNVCILLAHRRNRNDDDPPLLESFLLKEQTNGLWETIPLAVLTVLEDWLATFQAREVSACLGQCCPGTSWMPRSLQQ